MSRLIDADLLKKNCKCTTCEWEWKIRANHIMEGQRCPKCVEKENRKTTENFHKEYYDKYPESNIILGEYYSATDPVECKCKKCGFE